jgi:hypothetical protein
MAALLVGCSAAPRMESLRRGLAVDLRIGSGIAPARAPRASAVLRTDTVTPLSLWLLVTDTRSATPRPGITIELDVLDTSGAATRDAVVQPTRLRTDARGYAAPVTFLAAHAGEFVVRATYRDADLVVSAYSVRVVARDAATP